MISASASVDVEMRHLHLHPVSLNASPCVRTSSEHVNLLCPNFPTIYVRLPRMQLLIFSFCVPPVITFKRFLLKTLKLLLSSALASHDSVPRIRPSPCTRTHGPTARYTLLCTQNFTPFHRTTFHLRLHLTSFLHRRKQVL